MIFNFTKQKTINGLSYKDFIKICLIPPKSVLEEKIKKRFSEMLKKGAFTPGTQTLLYDIFDFGHHQADDEYQAFLKGYKIPG